MLASLVLIVYYKSFDVIPKYTHFTEKHLNELNKLNETILNQNLQEPPSRKPKKSHTTSKNNKNSTLSPINLPNFSCKKTCHPPEKTPPDFSGKYEEKNELKRYGLRAFRHIPKTRMLQPEKLLYINNYTTHHDGKLPDDQEMFDLAWDYVESFWEYQAHENEMKIPAADSRFETKIPEMYHYVWFNCHTFKLLHFISIFSILRLIQEDSEEHKNAVIVFHTDCVPPEQLFKNLVDYAGERLIIQKIKKVQTVWGNPIRRIEHVSDYYRLMVLVKFGGIYCDGDMMLLKSHSPFLNFEIPVIAEQGQKDLANGFMMAQPGCKIFLRWLLEYKFFSPASWNAFSVVKIFELWLTYPDEIHVEQGTMVRPRGKEKELIFDGYFDWTKSYNTHIYARYWKTMVSMMVRKYKLSFLEFSEFDCVDNSFGEIMRLILYGNYRRC